MNNKFVLGDCLELLKTVAEKIDLTFFDPPFNQKKEYTSHNDNMDYEVYWEWMYQIIAKIFVLSSEGSSIYFMQREKNAAEVIRVLKDAGWTYQNMIIWKKKTSAVPSKMRFAKQYQIIIFATKGSKPRVFNKLRIDPTLLVTEKQKRQNGIFITDIWDDIRELTSGYFAGDEPLRLDDGSRLHNQQSPNELLLRIILSSTNIGDLVLDPFAGTGTTHIVAEQLKRQSLSFEIDQMNYEYSLQRIESRRSIDCIEKYRSKYLCTEDLTRIWSSQSTEDNYPRLKQIDIIEIIKTSLG